jgi:hypothetical protein
MILGYLVPTPIFFERTGSTIGQRFETLRFQSLTPAQFSMSDAAPCVLPISEVHMRAVVGRVRCELCGTRCN